MVSMETCLPSADIGIPEPSLGYPLGAVALAERVLADCSTRVSILTRRYDGYEAGFEMSDCGFWCLSSERLRRASLFGMWRKTLGTIRRVRERQRCEGGKTAGLL